MLEERRVLYVGITRAEDRLFLTYAQNRSAYGYSEGAIPSRYLDDIPYDMLEDVQSERSRVRGGRKEAADGKSSSRVAERMDRWALPSPPNGQAKRVYQPRYNPGMRVIHPDWGEGMVLNSRVDNDDEILDIHFAGVGLKRVMASLARLEIKT